MRRRKLLAAMAGVALGVVALFLLFGETARDRVLRQKYERIEVGMTQADVVALLGPPGDQAPERPPRTGIGLGIGPDHSYCIEWWTDNVEVLVSFADNGPARLPSDRFLRKDIGPCTRESRLQRIAESLKRQWRRWFP
jgi:hypothetical protein